MSDPYRGRSRYSQSSGSTSSRGYQSTQPIASDHYSSTSQAPYSYPAASQYGTAEVSQSTYGYYSTSSPETSASGSHSHARSSSSGVPRHSTYPTSATASSTSERASKRQKAGTAPAHSAYNQAQWANPPAQGDPRYPAPHSHSSRGSRYERDSSVSSGYNSPGFSQSHDPYGQQLLQPPSIPGVGPSMRDVHHYGGRYPTSEYEEEEEEHLDHGPTELPPRTYSGKSKYDPPRKPGKIPGSAMDYLPILEARFDRLENAIDRYVDYRGQRALSNSILPGMDAPESSSSYYSQSSSKKK